MLGVAFDSLRRRRVNKEAPSLGCHFLGSKLGLKAVIFAPIGTATHRVRKKTSAEDVSLKPTLPDFDSSCLI